MELLVSVMDAQCKLQAMANLILHIKLTLY